MDNNHVQKLKEYYACAVKFIIEINRSELDISKFYDLIKILDNIIDNLSNISGRDAHYMLFQDAYCALFHIETKFLDLKKIKDNRDKMLLVEVAGWLHDWQKCIDMAIASHWQRNPYVDREKIKEWQKRGKNCKPKEFSDVLAANDISLCLDSSPLDFKTLIENGREPSKVEKSSFYLIKLLGKSHKSGHVEKELETNEFWELSSDWLSGPFGYEFLQPEGFICQLLKDPLDKLQVFFSNPTTETFKGLLNAIKPLFTTGWGDTRRPINEVTLWDWSSVVAALYKAEIARCVLTGQKRDLKDVRWRLLSIRTDGLSYLLSADSIPDLLVRKKLFEGAFDNVQNLIEEKYPIGLQVYRDENGSIFVVPDLQFLLELEDSEEERKGLKDFLIEKFKKETDFAIGGELIPEIVLSRPWNGEGEYNPPPIGVLVGRKYSLKSDISLFVERWKISESHERCTVCGLRPQAPSEKARERKVCDICEKRREDRAKEWAVNIGRVFVSTIWIDEVADKNGRIALITGKFDLQNWLTGDLVRSLAVRNPERVSDKTRTN